MLIAIEGVDGAGKRTLTEGLRAAFEAGGLRVATAAFPRYHVSLPADLAAEALHGRHGDLAESVHAMAVLFALDRAGARDELAALDAGHDVVLLDRYVASNAAYTAARLGPEREAEVVAWIGELEFDRLGLPAPDLQLLLDTPTEVAAERAGTREAADPGRTRDRYERDATLQADTGAAYRRLAGAHWRSPWRVLGVDPDVRGLADLVAGPGPDPEAQPRKGHAAG